MYTPTHTQNIKGNKQSTRHTIFKHKSRQENIDAKHQIRRPDIGCKLNILIADRTNIKVK